MLEVVPSADHVAAFRVSEQLTKQDYERVIAVLEHKLKVHARVAVYLDATTLTGISRAALSTDLRYGLSKLGQLPRFPRSALVCDRPWLRKVVEVATAVVPAMQVRTFASAERDAALQWATQIEPDAPTVAGLRLTATTRPDTWGIVWQGKVHAADLAYVVHELEDTLKAQAHLRLLVRVERIGGIEWRALLNAQLAHVKFVGARKLERYALVGDQSWLPSYIRLLRAVTRIDVRSFPRNREAEAWSWLNAQPVAEGRRTTGSQSASVPLN